MFDDLSTLDPGQVKNGPVALVLFYMAKSDHEISVAEWSVNLDLLRGSSATCHFSKMLGKSFQSIGYTR